jgi:hypothetical protein
MELPRAVRRGKGLTGAHGSEMAADLLDLGREARLPPSLWAARWVAQESRHPESIQRQRPSGRRHGCLEGRSTRREEDAGSLRVHTVVDPAVTREADGVRRRVLRGLGLSISDRHDQRFGPAYERAISGRSTLTGDPWGACRVAVQAPQVGRRKT